MWCKPGISTLIKCDGSFLLSTIVCFGDLAVALRQQGETLFSQFATVYGKHASGAASALVSTSSSATTSCASGTHARSHCRRSFTLRRWMITFCQPRYAAHMYHCTSLVSNKAQFQQAPPCNYRESYSAIRQSKPYLKLVANIFYAATATATGNFLPHFHALLFRAQTANQVLLLLH
eukprot:6174133-Pleurochrysis_carterae.AAC.1